MMVGAGAQGDDEERGRNSLAHGLKDDADTDGYQPFAEANPESHERRAAPLTAAHSDFTSPRL